MPEIKAIFAVGESYSGKTRACWEAVRNALPDWDLWHPLTPDRPQAVLDAFKYANVAPRTVIWLNEAQLYLSPLPAGNQVASALQELVGDPDHGPVLILGSMWPDYWRELTADIRDIKKNPHAAARALLRQAEMVRVPSGFRQDELDAVRHVVAADPRTAEGACCAKDGHITQFLAGAPIPPEATAEAADASITPASTANAVRDKRERIEFWPSFPYVLAQDMISASRERIRILQTWISDIQPFLADISKAFDNGSKLEILILNPESEAARLRARNLGIGDPSYPTFQKRKLIGDLEQLANSRKCNSLPCEIRMHDKLPSIELYGTETMLFVGIFWMTDFSLQGPHMQVETSDTVLGLAAWREFERAWEEAEPAPLNLE